MQPLTEKYTTAIWGCRVMAEALEAYGISTVVVSPGHRDAPLLIAINRSNALHTVPVVDERSAAFIALGIAQTKGEPVALVCTSGTAMLNYAPAVAEAYYKGIPLVVISADRPELWVDRADSQTIRQPGALANFVNSSVNVVANTDTTDGRRLFKLKINEALTAMQIPSPGPVHINIEIDAPLTQLQPCPEQPEFQKIETFSASLLPVAVDFSRNVAMQLHGRKVMVVVASCEPDARLAKAIGVLSKLPGVVLIAESLSNLHSAACDPDLVMAAAGLEEAPLPDPEIVVTFGGALVSARLKKYLRSLAGKGIEHWTVGPDSRLLDTFGMLTRRYEYRPELFFPRVANAMAHLARVGGSPSGELLDFSDAWERLSAKARQSFSKKVDFMPFSACRAVDILLGSLPKKWNLQLSNGMTVRLALMSPSASAFHRIDCNRGTSGIEGSTSTAVGASMAYSGTTLLITGDMSFQYDQNALSAITPNLKIVVMNNGGGGIFRYLPSTGNLEETPQLLQCAGAYASVEQLAAAYGCCYLRVQTLDGIFDAIELLKHTPNEPVIVEVVTDLAVDTAVYNALLSNH